MANEKGTRLSPQECERLQDVIEERGPRETAEEFKVSAPTLIKASASFPVHKSIAELIRLKLDTEGDQ
jgi:hypothetical protein